MMIGKKHITWPWKVLILVVLVGGHVLLARSFNIGGRIGELRAWIESLGVWGPAVFIPIYIAAVAAAIPGSAITILAGALFGSVAGVIIVSLASTIGASLCFSISRYVVRNSVESWLKGKEKFQKLDQLTEKHGAIIVAITRLVPIFPFNILNYGFGLTKVRFWTYVFWSWLCMLPGTILYVVGTDAVVTAIKEERIPWILIGIVVVVLAIVIFLANKARRHIKED